MPPNPPKNNERIWVIDDDPADRHLTLVALQTIRPNLTFKGFASLRSALASLEDGNRPSVVFVDWTLPGEDTRTAPSKIGRYGAWTCLLTNLDCAMIPDREAFDSFGSKPYGFEALCQLLEGALQKWGDSDTPTSP